LFPGYVFARLALRDRLQVLQVPGVARLVGFGGQPTALADEEMDALRQGLGGGLRAEPHPYLKVGRRARVKAGPLQGMEGILVKKKNQLRFVISLDLIMRSVAVELDETDLAPSNFTEGPGDRNGDQVDQTAGIPGFQSGSSYPRNCAGRTISGHRGS